MDAFRSVSSSRVRSLVAAACAALIVTGGVARAQSPLDRFDPGADGRVRAMAVQADGKVIVGGEFTHIGGGGTGSTDRSLIARLNVDGSVDPSFDPGADGVIFAIAVQPDGRILVGGAFTHIGGGGTGSTPRAFIARLEADGSVDTGFDPGADSIVYAMVVQPDGKIVVGGAFSGLGSGSGATPRNHIGRLNSNGSVDTFDPGADADVRTLALQPNGRILAGGAFTALGTGGTEAHVHIGRVDDDGTADGSFNPSTDGSVVLAIALQVDGKILVGGDFSNVNGDSRQRLARLATGGALDAAFDPGAGGEVDAIVVQPDGWILVAGLFTTLGGGGAGTTDRFYVGRLAPDGSLDTAFDPAADDAVLALAVQSDRKIVLGGQFAALGDCACATPRSYLARLHQDGSVEVDFDPGADDRVLSASLQPDGKVVVGGDFITLGADTHYYVGRIHADGAVDNTFLLDEGANCGIASTLVQPDGKIIVAGQFTDGSGFCGTTDIPRNSIARLNADGSFDPAFDAEVDTEGILNVVRQPDGKLLIAGFFGEIAGYTRRGIARLNADGTLDAAFDVGVNAPVLAMTLQPDGKIIIGGFFQYVGGGNPGFGDTERNYIARLNANGTVDPTFNPGADAPVLALALQPDGQVVVGGAFEMLGGGVGDTERNFIGRIDADGVVDASFDPGADAIVSTLALQADGRILVGGAFLAMGGGGTGDTDRFGIARLETNGTLDDTFDPGADFDVYGLTVQPDGKVIAVGEFDGLGGGVGDTARSQIGRLTNTGAAIQSLAITGAYVLTWSRSGAGPELDYATMEVSTDGSTWDPAEDATRVDGGWQVSGLSLATDQNLYIRTRGFYHTAGLEHSTGSIVEAVWNVYVSASATDDVVKLIITEVNTGVSPVAGIGFDVVVKSAAADDTPTNVTADTSVVLSVATGTGTIFGVLTGTITAGTNEVTISGTKYTRAEANVRIRATRTSGDLLGPGVSAPFTVLPGPYTTYRLTPATANVLATVADQITIDALDAFGNVANSASGSVTVAGRDAAGTATNASVTVGATSSGVFTGSLSVDVSSGSATFYVKNSDAEVFRVRGDDPTAKTGTSSQIRSYPFATAGQVIIREFRFRGTAGDEDEYVSLYNNTDSPILVGTLDPDNDEGWTLAGADGLKRFTIPNGTLLPARSNYLGVNTDGFSLGDYPAGVDNQGFVAYTDQGDIQYTDDIPSSGVNAGIALFRSSTVLSMANRLDAVGYANVADTLYKEGGGLPTGGAEQTNDFEFAFVRNMITGVPKDTNQNQNDFVPVVMDTAAGSTGPGGASTKLGSAGPLSSGSPLRRTAIAVALIPGVPVASNGTVRDNRDTVWNDLSLTAPDGKGLLSVPKRFTNNTGQAVSRVRVRIVDITGAPWPGGSAADIRAIDATGTVTDSSGATIASGLAPMTVELVDYSKGGGLNATLTLDLCGCVGPIAPGDFIDVHILLGVVKPGSFRFFIMMEALP